MNRVPDTDKETSAKQGALDQTLWQFNRKYFPNSPAPSVDLATCARTKSLLSLSDASNNVISATKLSSITPFGHLYLAHPSLHIVTGLLVHVSDALTSLLLVVPQSHRGVKLMHAHEDLQVGDKV